MIYNWSFKILFRKCKKIFKQMMSFEEMHCISIGDSNETCIKMGQYLTAQLPTSYLSYQNAVDIKTQISRFQLLDWTLSSVSHTETNVWCINTESTPGTTYYLHTPRPPDGQEWTWQYPLCSGATKKHCLLTCQSSSIRISRLGLLYCWIFFDLEVFLKRSV